jgi:hypothetical protein
MIHGLVVVTRLVYEPDAVQTIAATVVANAIDCTEAFLPTRAVTRTTYESHDRLWRYRF